MKKRNLKNLTLNKKSIVDFSNAIKGQGMLTSTCDTAQSFCYKRGASCHTCPVATQSEQTVCCD